MTEDAVRVPLAPGSREPSPTVSALTGFDPSRYRIPWPDQDETLEVISIPPEDGKRWRVIWRMEDDLGWLDAGHIAAFATEARAEEKVADVVRWICQRSAQGVSTRSAETEGLSPQDASPVPSGMRPERATTPPQGD